MHLVQGVKALAYRVLALEALASQGLALEALASQGLALEALACLEQAALATMEDPEEVVNFCCPSSSYRVPSVHLIPCGQ
jgi:hypothetical protein